MEGLLNYLKDFIVSWSFRKCPKVFSKTVVILGTKIYEYKVNFENKEEKKNCTPILQFNISKNLSY